MHKKIFPACLLLIFASIYNPLQAPLKNNTRPNILLKVGDDVGHTSLGRYGGDLK